MAGAAGTVPKLNQLPLPPEEDGEPGIVEKAGVLGRAARSGAKWALEGGPSGRSAFSYSILKDGEHIGEVHGTVDGAVANVHWMGSNEKITSDALNTMHEAFKRDFPDVEVFKGDRISGARGQARDELMRRAKQARLEGDEKEALALSTKAEDISIQHVKLREAGGGLAAALMASGQMHMQDDDVEEVGLKGGKPNIFGSSNKYAGATHTGGLHGPESAAKAAASKNLLKWGDTPVWAVVIDEKSGRVIHGVPYEKAKEADFHHSHYLPESMTERVNAGKARIVWGDGRGLQSMEPMPDDLKEVVAGQVGKGTAAVAGAAGAAATGSDDAEAGIIGKAAGKFAISANESKLKNRFLYTMQRDGQPIGVLKGIITPSGKAHVFWIGDATEAEGKKISLKYGEIRDLMKRLKEDFPQATHWQGDRLSGAHEGGLQQTKLREGASGFMAALGAAGAVLGDDEENKPPDPVREAVGTVAGEVGGLLTDQADVGRMAGKAASQVAQALMPGDPPPPDSLPLSLPPDAETIGTAQPPRDLGDRAYQRFWGTDVEDPLPLKRAASTIAGGIGGAVLGGSLASSVPIPAAKAVGTLAGGVIGTVAGAVAPEGTMEFLETTGALPEGYRETMGLSPKDLKTVAEGEALLDAGTFGLFAAAKGAGRGLVKLATGVNKGGRQLSEDALREGIALMPVQVGDRIIGRMYVNTLGRFPLFAGPIKSAGMETVKRLEDAYKRFPARIAPLASMSDIHMKVLGEVQGAVTRVNDQFIQQYDRIFSNTAVTVGMEKTGGAIMDFGDELSRMVPAKPAGKGTTRAKIPGRVKDLQKFASDVLFPLGTEEAGMATQTLKQADTVLNAIEQKMKYFGEKGDVGAVAMLERVQNSLLLDMRTGLKGPGAEAVQAELKATDEEFAQVTEELFSNGMAKNLGITPAQGVRGARFKGTHDSVANIIGTVIRTSDPAAVTDLSRLLDPGTFKELAANVINSRLAEGLSRNADGTFNISADGLSKSLGLADPKSTRYLQTQELLAKSGSGMDMGKLQRLFDMTKAIEAVPLPDVSTFVARKGIMQGVQGIMSGILPFAVGAAAGHAGGQHPVVSGLMGVLSIVGVRGISSMLANPASSRMLNKAMDEAAPKAIRAAAFHRAVRLGIYSMEGTEDTFKEKALELYDMWTTQVKKREALNMRPNTGKGQEAIPMGQ